MIATGFVRHMHNDEDFVDVIMLYVYFTFCCTVDALMKFRNARTTVDTDKPLPHNAFKFYGRVFAFR